MTTEFEVRVRGIGPPKCDYMIVGEAPGRVEIKRGIPFVPDADCGGLLQKAFAVAGTSREAIYITNAFKGDVGDGNPRPTRKQLNDHRPLLLEEIKTVEPRIIMTLGQRAACALDVLPTLSSPLGCVVDQVKRVPFEGVCITVLPWFHPGHVLRGGATEAEFGAAMVRFLAVPRRPEPPFE